MSRLNEIEEKVITILKSDDFFIEAISEIKKFCNNLRIPYNISGINEAAAGNLDKYFLLHRKKSVNSRFIVSIITHFNDRIKNLFELHSDIVWGASEAYSNIGFDIIHKLYDIHVSSKLLSSGDYVFSYIITVGRPCTFGKGYDELGYKFLKVEIIDAPGNVSEGFHSYKQFIQTNSNSLIKHIASYKEERSRLKFGHIYEMIMVYEVTKNILKAKLLNESSGDKYNMSDLFQANLLIREFSNLGIKIKDLRDISNSLFMFLFNYFSLPLRTIFDLSIPLEENINKISPDYLAHMLIAKILQLIDNEINLIKSICGNHFEDIIKNILWGSPSASTVSSKKKFKWKYFH